MKYNDGHETYVALRFRLPDQGSEFPNRQEVDVSEPAPQFSKLGFVKTFVLPALTIFLIPAISLAFFLRAQHTFDVDLRDAMVEGLRSDETMTEKERAEAIKFYSEIPVSRLMKNKEFAAEFDDNLVFYYATFRWMIRISAISIVSGIAVILLGGICVLLSLRSHVAQYMSLAAGWNVLRIYAALQTIVQSVMVVALSFWVTALLFEVYFVKLIIVAGLIALCAVVALIRAIFAPVKSDFELEGTVIDPRESPRLWNELQRLCETVGTSPPDQVIAGIDDNFFVTEVPLKVEERTYKGRTLYVSLPLLGQLHRSEADAVLAHEMAHFSGNDTLYTKKTAPLLERYGNYLQGLSESPLSLPVFYFMLLFRGLFELSLSKVSREREFRADRIATESTSSAAMVGALLRIIAYSKYRDKIEQELFDHEKVLDTANISERIQRGFPQFVKSFLADPSVGEMQSTHPFDSHPPLAERLAAVGIELESHQARQLVAAETDGQWLHNVEGAVELERKHWEQLESRFREYHEQTLPYRFLPETEEERLIVEKAFPLVRFDGKEGSLIVDYEKMTFEGWSEPVMFSEVSSFTLHDNNRLQITYDRGKAASEWIKVNKFGNQQQALLETVANYHARYATAIEYQQHRQETGDGVSA